MKKSEVVESVTTLPRDMTFAVAPVLNFSGSMELDPIQLADLLASELSQTRRAAVIPVSRVVAVLASQGRTSVESPQHAVQVAQALGADAILVAGITEYDAYTPVVGLIVQMYLTNGLRPASLDAVAASRMDRSFDGPRMGSMSGPGAQVQGTYNAMHESVVERVQKYARERSESDHPQGWRQYLQVQRLYLRFCWHDALQRLLNQDSWKLAVITPMELDHE